MKAQTEEQIEGVARMKRLFIPLILLALIASGGCMQRTITTDAGNANATNANAASTTNAPGANANAANSNGAREGTGPGGTGIGGTSEGNRNATVSGNSNVEPAGVNRNVGATPPPNRNR
jgi:hypothetical protein